MGNMVMESMIMENMESTGKNKQNKKNYKYTILKGIAVTLAVLNIVVIFIWPELPLKVFKLEKESIYNTPSDTDKGNEKSILRVNKEKKMFDGKGMFDPMDSVEAYDTNGENILDKVAYAYIPGQSIEKKQILYTVYDSDLRRLEASCELILKNYHGPAISLGEIGSVSWEELQNLTEVLAERELLHTDDGFGNACMDKVTYYYDIDPEEKRVEITFSLSNGFQDYVSKKIKVSIDKIPEEYFETLKTD